MTKKVLLSSVVLILSVNIIDGSSRAIYKRGVHDYGPPIYIASSVLAFEQVDESLLGNSNNQWDGTGAVVENQDASGYLKFAGVVGSGHIYVPIDSDDEFGKVSDGVLGASEW